MSRPSTPRQILSPKCDQVRNLVAATRRLQELTEGLRVHLPEDERSHLRAVTLANPGGIVWVDSPAWATRFRYSVPVFLNLLRNLPGAGKITSLQVKTLPREMLEVPESLPLRRLSAEAEQTISACAAHIEDPMLRAALQRLAANTTNHSKTPLDKNRS